MTFYLYTRLSFVVSKDNKNTLYFPDNQAYPKKTSSFWATKLETYPQKLPFNFNF
jgi:hypothetical protein